MKNLIKAQSKVLIIAGNFKNKEAIVLKVSKKNNRAFVQSDSIPNTIKMVKPKKQYGLIGGPKEIPKSIHISNLRKINDKATT